jgi:hypothetical protein
MTWTKDLAVEARELLAQPWRGNRPRRVRVLLAKALFEIERLAAENRRLQLEVDREVFRGAVLGPGGNLGPNGDDLPTGGLK